MKKIFDNLIIKLILAVLIGFGIGTIANETTIGVIITADNIISQLIFFSIPLVIIGFIAPSIAKLKNNASTFLKYATVIAYLSSLGAAAFAMFGGYKLIPILDIQNSVSTLKEMPELIFNLEIPPVMSVMTALVLSIMLGLAVSWTNARIFEEALDEFQEMVLSLINRIVIPLLPFFIATTFAELAYEGSLTEHAPVFITVIAIVLVGHFIWLTILYSIAGVISRKNPIDVIKHYGPAYVTALGSMSSSATMPIALKCASKSKVLRKDTTNFTIPLCANIHLCGSVLTEVFFVMVVSKILYGQLPSLSSMILFIILLGVFAIGAPGVPGGTVMASLGLIVSVLGFDATGTGLMMTIFALQDSFGTACNVVGDGAIALMITGIANKKDSMSKIS